MSDSPLILPDADFVEKFTEKTPKTRPIVHTSVRVDAHIDLPYYMISHGIERSFAQLSDAPFTPEKALATNARLFCTALYCEDSFNGPGSESRYQEILDFSLSHMDTVHVIRDAQDLKGIHEDPDGLFTILLLENADFLADDPTENISRLHQDGIRIVGLTHMAKNRLADGNGVDFADGISDVGKEVIRLLTESNITIDTAHLHPKSFWQLMDLIERPLICSHTGVQEVCKVPRNLALDQIWQIVDRGGIVGITLNPEMLSTTTKVGVDIVFAHVDTIVQKFGPNVVGIGSDLGGFDRAPAELSGPEALIRLEEVMEKHGYDEAAIKAIMGDNWLRFFEQTI